MDTKQRACLRAQVTEKRKQLETLVHQGAPLTSAAVLAISSDLDRLIILLQAPTKPDEMDGADCD